MVDCSQCCGYLVCSGNVGLFGFDVGVAAV